MDCVAQLINDVAYLKAANQSTADLKNLTEFYSEYLSQVGKPFTEQFKLDFVSEKESISWPCPGDKYAP